MLFEAAGNSRAATRSGNKGKFYVESRAKPITYLPSE
jgi:hypothetical protein